MADIEHSDLGGNANQHAIHRWAHADQAARYAESVAASDVGKISKQASDNTYWVLVDHTQVGNATGWKEISAQARVFSASWGCAPAAASTLQRFLLRTGGTMNGVAGVAEYPIGVAGTLLFTGTWRVGGTPLATDSCVVEIFKNGVATGVTGTVAAGAGGATGQFSGQITVAIGDGIAFGVKQSSTEAQASWNFSGTITAVLV